MGQSSRMHTPSRSGLSLLEILISVFVLSIGLLGVAAVIPLGHHQILEATKSDRAAACGRAALHEIKTRGWINPSQWRQMAVNEANPTVNWLPYTFPVTFDTDPSSNGLDDLAIPLCDSFAIDPLFFAHQGLPDYDNSSNPLVWRFPLDATAEDMLTEERRSSLVRVTFDQADWSVVPPPLPNPMPFTVPVPEFGRMPFAAANRVLTWRDDMLFPVPDDPDERPRQFAVWDGGEGLAYPLRMTDFVTNMIPSGPGAPTSPMISQADNNYSWMATVTPIFDAPGHDFWVTAPIPSSAPAPLDSTVDPLLPDPWTRTGYWGYWRSYSYLNIVTRYTVSIVVFYRRDFRCPESADLSDVEYPPQERSVSARFPGNGFGGGDVFLYYDTDPSNNPLGKSDVWLNVKKDDWIMLRGLELVLGPSMRSLPVGALNAPSVGFHPFRRVVAKWYRVVAVDEVIDETVNGTAVRGRYVTLDGPNWQVDTDGDGQFEPFGPANDPLNFGLFGPLGFDVATATLVDNVIGVFTTTVEADFTTTVEADFQ